MHFVGLAGMPRRIPDYAVQFTDFNMIASVGAFGFGLSQLLFVYILFQTLRQPVTAADKSWEGAEGLEGHYHLQHHTIHLIHHQKSINEKCKINYN